ncbi:unnamed protein product [Closterium sp. Naga37s-1]|nr:unnamed protein product [Closterium sp. Naga37s-1]
MHEGENQPWRAAGQLRAGFGPYQLFLVCYTGLAWLADAMEMILLSFVGPADASSPLCYALCAPAAALPFPSRIASVSPAQRQHVSSTYSPRESRSNQREAPAARAAGFSLIWSKATGFTTPLLSFSRPCHLLDSTTLHY